MTFRAFALQRVMLGRPERIVGGGAAGQPGARRWPLADLSWGRAPLASVVAVAVVAVLVRRFDAPLVVAGLLACGAAALLITLPEVATVSAVFLLYTNIPALATKHGVPHVIASSFMLLLVFPLLHHVVVHQLRPKADVTFCVMLGYLVVLLLSSLGAKGPQLATKYVTIYFVEGIVLYLLLVNAIRTRVTLSRVIWTAIAAGSLLAALTTYQEATGTFERQFGGLAQRNSEYMQLRQRAEEDPEARDALQKVRAHHRSRRPGGPFGEPNRFAQVLIVLLPLVVWAYRAARRPWSRAWAALCGISIVSGIGVSNSRGAFLVVALAALAAAALRWIRPSRILTGALVVALIVPVVAPGVVARAATLASVTQLSRDPAASDEVDGAIRGRATEMLAALYVFLDHPVLGVGPGQFAPFYVVQYSQDPAIKFRDVRETMRAHNLYLEIAAEVGFIGLTVFLTAVAVLLQGLWRQRRRWLPVHPEHADLATALWLSVVMYLCSGMTMHLAYQRYYWFLLAIAAAGVHVLQSRETVDELAEDSRDAATARRIGRGAGLGSIRSMVRP